MKKKYAWKQYQRVVTRTEPQLGVGIIQRISTEQNTLGVHFPLTNTSRQYSILQNSLQRFQLSIGDLAKTHQDTEKHIELTVESIEEDNGVITYHGQKRSIIEIDLDHQAQDSSTVEQFFAGLWTHHQTYSLRQKAWEIRSSLKNSPVRGLVGPKVTPLPHQLYVAKSVTQYSHPRVLLADEVGLGKTIEAGLIFSSLRSIERANRVLIITPESLKHQWLSEMFRRFNELFTVFDENRYEEELEEHDNPFLQYQKILCSINFSNTDNVKQTLLTTEWDLIIIDEAHHLHWSPEAPSPQWSLIKKLADQSQGLLLLTATPQLDGLESQFGLLNIVDSARFSNFEDFKAESQKIQNIAKIAKSIAQNTLTENQKNALKENFPHDDEIQELTKTPVSNIDKDKLLKILIDRHGTGRILFRNRRERLKGFPKRNLITYPIENNSFISSTKVTSDLKEKILCFSNDNQVLNIKLEWLKTFLKKEEKSKFLILCSSKNTVLKAQIFLNKHTSVQTAIFHEDLSIVERDIQAAQFAQKQNTQILICSEIGGEGRNFQFVQDLILLDIPNHPDIVEQRIGRLDRIGQKNEIFIHVPWIQNSIEHIIFKWYEEGLESFQSSWNGANHLFKMFSNKLNEIMSIENDHFREELNTLIKKTQKVANEYKRTLNESIDILVDLNSFNESKGQVLLDQVDDIEDNPSLELFIKDLFSHYGVENEEYDDRGTLLIRPSELMFIEDFPGLKKHEDTLFTFDRQLALKREDMIFLTQDHHITTEILSMLLDRNEGVASLCHWPDSPLGKGIIVELSFLLESIGPQQLELDTYLPTQIKELQFNHQGQEISVTSHKESPELIKELLDHDKPSDLLESRPMIEPIINKALSDIKKWSSQKIQDSLKHAQTSLEQEAQRLKYLDQVNPNVTQTDVDHHREKTEQTLNHLKKTQPRLDSIRMIFTN